MSEKTRDEIDVKGSVEACYAVAADFAAYPEWEKNTRKSEVKETDEQGRGTKVWFEFETPIKNALYTLAYDHSKSPHSLSFDLLEGDLREMNGTWTFQDKGEAVTTVTYEVSVRPDFPLPNLLKRAIEKKHARSCVKIVKTRVEGG
jgi:ribosome-associated toxin RatA of RatAB toxin-antitoxin module